MSMAVAIVYYRLVKSGAWTVENVPPRWRDRVQALVDADDGK